MQNRFTQKQIIGLVCIVLLVVAVFIGLSVYNTSRFVLKDSTPDIGGTVPTSTSTILLKFSKPLDPTKDYRRTLEEKEPYIVNSVYVEDNNLRITLKQLIKNKQYAFTLKDITAKDGRVIKSVPVSFTARYVPYNQLPSDQKKLEVGQTDRQTASDPILQYLPHQGERFYLKAEFTSSEEDTDILVINAELFLSREDLGAARSQAIQKYKDRVAAFFRSKQLDPEKYYIRYTINEPPAAPN